MKRTDRIIINVALASSLAILATISMAVFACDGAEYAEEHDITEVAQCGEAPEPTDTFVEECEQWILDNHPKE